MNFKDLTLTQAAKLIDEKKLSSKELVAGVFDVIKESDEDIHAYIETFEQETLIKAEAVDDARARGEEKHLLAGVPIAVKDNILIRGRHVSASSKILEDYVATYDATVIKKLKNTEAIFIGRTNMDEFAMGSSTESSAFGITRNPHDLKCVPGGSSGGSAAAVAAGEALAALGSDTGGSIRQPAAFCGVVGLKPTYGAVSRNGLIAMASSLDQIGPITKTVEDAELLFNVMKGKDPFDSTTVEPRNMEHRAHIKKEITIGIPKEYFIEGLDPEIKKAVEKTVNMLRDAGYVIRDVSLPHTDYALPCYYIIMPAEVSANLSRFDGMRFGLSKDGDSLFDVYAQTRRHGLGAEVRRRVMLGAYVLSAGYYDAYYAKAQKVRSLIKKDFEKAFEEVDVIISPTTPSPAFKIGEKTSDPLQMYLADIYTISANLAGIPAMSVPCGKTEKGLPIGIQLMGKWFDEPTLFEVGKKIEKIAK